MEKLGSFFRKPAQTYNIKPEKKVSKDLKEISASNDNDTIRSSIDLVSTVNTNEILKPLGNAIKSTNDKRDALTKASKEEVLKGENALKMSVGESMSRSKDKSKVKDTPIANKTTPKPEENFAAKLMGEPPQAKPTIQTEKSTKIEDLEKEIGQLQKKLRIEGEKYQKEPDFDLKKQHAVNVQNTLSRINDLGLELDNEIEAQSKLVKAEMDDKVSGDKSTLQKLKGLDNKIDDLYGKLGNNYSNFEKSFNFTNLKEVKNPAKETLELRNSSINNSQNILKEIGIAEQEKKVLLGQLKMEILEKLNTEIDEVMEEMRGVDDSKDSGEMDRLIDRANDLTKRINDIQNS